MSFTLTVRGGAGVSKHDLPTSTVEIRLMYHGNHPSHLPPTRFCNTGKSASQLRVFDKLVYGDGIFCKAFSVDNLVGKNHTGYQKIAA